MRPNHAARGRRGGTSNFNLIDAYTITFDASLTNLGLTQSADVITVRSDTREEKPHA